MRIFIGNKEVAGIFTFLYFGFKELGIDVSIFLPEQHVYKYQDVRRSWIEKILNQLYRFLSQNRKTKIIRDIGYYIYEFIKFWVHLIYFPYLLIRYDVFIFSSGTTFFWGYDLPIFRLFGKKVIAVFTGSDTRPVYINTYFLQNTPTDILSKKASIQKEKIQELEKYGVISINNPPTAIFHSKPYIKWLNIGIPVKRNFAPTTPKEKSQTLEILHSPSNSVIKGSKHILESMEKIQSKYKDDPRKKIKFTLLQGVPNKEVVNYIQRSDFMIDQLYSDTPMAVFASEAAFFGKPSVVGGTYAKDIHHHYDTKDIPPTLYITPDKIDEAIEKMITDNEYRNQLSKATQKFVHENWSPIAVAKKYLKIINNDIPKNWWSDPNEDLLDVYPIGEDELIYNGIKKIIDKHGLPALQISDKPHLEKIILERVKKFTEG
jgi:glycosyltransferase involved in cell wall biosynthesis